MTTRRYDEDEVQKILRLATTGSTAERSLPADSGGLTLEQLQQIGSEAGIAPDRVAHAVATLDARGGPAVIRRSLGMPIGVSQVVDLPRAPTDREWEQLISLFRTTFGSQGTAITNGGLREWAVGNLHICVEPTAHGEQLRLSTLKGDARELNVVGFALAGMSVALGGALGFAASPSKAIWVVGMFATVGVAMIGANMIRLPRWARQRERQMQDVAEHAVKLLSGE